MRDVGVVTDKDWFDVEIMYKDNPVGFKYCRWGVNDTGDKRIFPDEVPLADEPTINFLGRRKYWTVESL